MSRQVEVVQRAEVQHQEVRTALDCTGPLEGYPGKFWRAEETRDVELAFEQWESVDVQSSVLQGTVLRLPVDREKSDSGSMAFRSSA